MQTPRPVLANTATASRCFYQRARARLRAAQVIVVNHALLFALINAGGAQARGRRAETDARGVLFPEDFVVLDEAHTVPEVATAHFGLSISSYGIDRTLKHLYNPRTKRGLLRKVEEARRLGSNWWIDALAASKRFFDSLEETLLSVRPRGAAAGGGRHRLAQRSTGPWRPLQRVLGKNADQTGGRPRPRDELLEQLGPLQGHPGLDRRLADPRRSQSRLLGRAAAGAGRRSSPCGAAPIDVAPALKRHLFGAGVNGVVCTSATLGARRRDRPLRRADRRGRRALGRRQVPVQFPGGTCGSTSRPIFRCPPRRTRAWPWAPSPITLRSA